MLFVDGRKQTSFPPHATRAELGGQSPSDEVMMDFGIRESVPEFQAAPPFITAIAKREIARMAAAAADNS